MTPTTRSLIQAIEEQQSQQRKLIWHDGVVCWLYPDDSHRGLDAADTLLINNALRTHLTQRTTDEEALFVGQSIDEAEDEDDRLLDDGWHHDSDMESRG